MTSILVTGGCGFIGSNFIRSLLETKDVSVRNFDCLTYAGNLANLKDFNRDPRYRFIRGDITDRDAVRAAMKGVHSVIHFAAESHVDRSIHDSGPFVRTNVLGTQVLLDAAREFEVQRFVHVSTDEVYGSLGPTGAFTEETPLAPNSPYSASKAASDLLVRSYVHTFGFPAVITRCSNNYGPYQFPEKLIPLVIHKALHGEPLPVYGDGLNVRDWLYVGDHCAAIRRVLEAGRVGETYNVGGDAERENIHVVKTLCALLDQRRPRADGKPRESQITYVKDRPGHDRRYAIDASKIQGELGWKPAVSFEQGIAATVDWYLAHGDWVRRVLDGSYRLERIGTEA
jgi:dTDP-glucose 4,6-dehydratase